MIPWFDIDLFDGKVKISPFGSLVGKAENVRFSVDIELWDMEMP